MPKESTKELLDRMMKDSKLPDAEQRRKLSSLYVMDPWVVTYPMLMSSLAK